MAERPHPSIEIISVGFLCNDGECRMLQIYMNEFLAGQEEILARVRKIQYRIVLVIPNAENRMDCGKTEGRECFYYR